MQVKQMKEDGFFIRLDKYVTEILKKFGFSDVKTASIPMETHKPLLKDADGKDVDEHMYRSMIGSLMYLTSSRPDIIFDVCVCARFQVNHKVSHLHAVKRIFRYLKGQPILGLGYPKDSPFDLVAYSDSDYTGASLDRKSAIGVKNPVSHSKTKHIKIRHHFIRVPYEKKLIQMIKIYTDKNVADLLTKAFDEDAARIECLTNADIFEQLALIVKIGAKDSQQDGKDKLVKSSTLIGSLMPRELKEAQEMMIFTLELLTQVTQAVTSKDCQLGNPSWEARQGLEGSLRGYKKHSPLAHTGSSSFPVLE
ncbi:hypothetical protein Tco_1208342 [Tanacetum coccineum]